MGPHEHPYQAFPAVAAAGSSAGSPGAYGRTAIRTTHHSTPSLASTSPAVAAAHLGGSKWLAHSVGHPLPPPLPPHHAAIAAGLPHPFTDKLPTSPGDLALYHRLRLPLYPIYPPIDRFRHWSTPGFAGPAPMLPGYGLYGPGPSTSIPGFDPSTAAAASLEYKMLLAEILAKREAMQQQHNPAVTIATSARSTSTTAREGGGSVPDVDKLRSIMALRQRASQCISTNELSPASVHKDSPWNQFNVKPKFENQTAETFLRTRLK